MSAFDRYCGAVWYFGWTGLYVCVCVFWEVLAHRGNHTVCRSSQAAWPFGTPQTACLCGQHAKSTGFVSPQSTDIRVYMLEHTPTLVRRGFTSQVLKHEGLLFDGLRALLLLPSSNKAMPHFKWKDFRLSLCHHCCCFDSACDHIWHLTDAHAMIRFECIRIIAVCNGNRVFTSCEGSGSAERVNAKCGKWKLEHVWGGGARVGWLTQRAANDYAAPFLKKDSLLLRNGLFSQTVKMRFHSY